MTLWCLEISEMKLAVSFILNTHASFCISKLSHVLMTTIVLLFSYFIDYMEVTGLQGCRVIRKFYVNDNIFELNEVFFFTHLWLCHNLQDSIN